MILIKKPKHETCGENERERENHADERGLGAVLRQASGGVEPSRIVRRGP